MIVGLWYSAPASENPVESEVNCMKRKVLFISLLLISLVISPCLSWAWSGRVIGIAGGDTITVLRDKKQVRIRLYGIDTPEKGQAFSKKARQFTAKLVHGKVVEVEPVDVDRYGRTVGIVKSEDVILNEELVREGFAWVYPQYCHRPICNTWYLLEMNAHDAKKGLWVDPHPIPPWEFRRQKRKGGK
jgi:micrococcal nuclease